MLHDERTLDRIAACSFLEAPFLQSPSVTPFNAYTRMIGRRNGRQRMIAILFLRTGLGLAGFR